MNCKRIACKISLLWVLLILSCAAPQHRIVVPDQGFQIDPGIVYGLLPNGFQYILKQNSIPAGHVNIHLNIFAGSMHETDEQQGVAHFLEHMLFNGSEHFKPGELIEYFQSIGMDFGSDANAHTSFFNTGYDLSLPKSDHAFLDKAFVVIQDYAQGALLLKSEIERERGIIFAEKRERDSVSYRTFKKALEFELPGSLLNQRFPIGIDPVLKNADQDLLKSYYDQWYRPDNMALVVIGDMDVKMAEEMIIQRFSKLKPRAGFVKPAFTTQWQEHEGVKSFYHNEQEAGSTDITIQAISWEPFETQTLEMLKQDFLDHIANSLLQNRLSRMVTQQTADFSAATAFSGSFLRHISMASISATCEPGKWGKGLEQIEKALRQGLVYGFTPKELDRVKADLISSLEKQVDQADTQKTSFLSRSILESINEKKLLLSPQQKKDLLTPYIESVSVQDAQDALKRAWAKNNRLILLTGNAQINAPDPPSRILAVYTASNAATIDKYSGFESGHFPYLELPDQRFTIRSKQENVKNLGITSIEFDNNVQLNLKKTDYKQNEMLFKVCFGQGKKSEPISKPGLSLVGEGVIKASGLGRLDTDQLEEALAGNKVNIGFQVNDNYFSLSGSGDPKEAERIFQLIYHYMNDPGFRGEALELTQTIYQQQYDSFLRTPEGIMRIKGDLFLAKNDNRFGLPHPDTLGRYTLDDLKHWMTPYFKESAVEVSIVGDFDEKKIIGLASTYLGAFKKRKPFPDQLIPVGKIIFPKGEQIEFKPETKIDSAVVRVAFLTDDFWNIRKTRQLGVLSRLVSERMRILIREDLGATYSSYAYNDPSKIFKNYGVMHVVANVKPGKQMFVYDKIKEIVESIVTDGITKKETELSLKPVLNHLKVIRKTNGYWLNSVMANASTYPEKFDWANTIMDDYQTIGQDDLMQLAKKYLIVENSALIVITPGNSSN